jgi:hypothetical protein
MPKFYKIRLYQSPVSALGSRALPEIGPTGAFFGLALCHSAQPQQLS